MSRRKKSTVDLQSKGGVYVAGGGQEIEIGISRLEYKELATMGAVYGYDDDKDTLVVDRATVIFVVD